MVDQGTLLMDKDSNDSSLFCCFINKDSPIMILIVVKVNIPSIQIQTKDLKNFIEMMKLLPIEKRKIVINSLWQSFDICTKIYYR